MPSSVTTSQMECTLLEALTSHPMKPLPSFPIKAFGPKIIFKGIRGLSKTDASFDDALRLKENLRDLWFEVVYGVEDTARLKASWMSEGLQSDGSSFMT